MKQSNIFGNSVSGSLWLGHKLLGRRVGNEPKQIDRDQVIEDLYVMQRNLYCSSRIVNWFFKSCLSTLINYEWLLKNCCKDSEAVFTLSRKRLWLGWLCKLLSILGKALLIVKWALWQLCQNSICKMRISQANWAFGHYSDDQ